MFENQPYIPQEFLRPLVNGWIGKIEGARAARKKWEDQAKECHAFFSEPAGFMWDEKYGNKFWSGVKAPRFKMTMNKAFELVAIFGPTLWSNVPHRTVEPKATIEFPPELFGNPEDPQVQQMYQQVQQELTSERASDKTRAYLMETWLNYTSREQPGGGLDSHGEMAVTEALIKGRSTLWPKPYKMPGSNNTLTGCFWHTVDDLFIDPDFGTLDEARWIARRMVQPTWVVERRFNLPDGSLKKKGTLESSYSHGERLGHAGSGAYRNGALTNDLIEYYEVWSKTGAGSRMAGVDLDIGDHLDRVVGDYAYIVVSPSVPFPLNAASEHFRKGASDTDVKSMFEWPIPTWADDRWPVAILDFYPQPGSVWPIPPLAPGLGELKFLNVMISHLCNRIWTSSRDFIAVAKSAYAEVREHLEKGGDQTILPVNGIHDDIRKVVQFMQQPQTNFDVWRIIEAVSDIFDRRTGLTDLMYGLNPGGTQPRSAEEVAAKRASIAVRPDFMAKKVEKWSSEAQAIEAFCTRLFVKGEDVQPLVGRVGRQMWEQLVMSTDVNKVVREMSYKVAAGSTRAPNKDRDVANVNQFMNTFLPIVSQYSQGTGNLEPLNALIKTWGKASDMDISGMLLPPPPQQEGPDPAQQQAEQMAQMELQKKQQELQLDAAKQQQKMQLDAAMAQQKMQMEMASRQQSMQLDAAKGQQNIQLDMLRKQQNIQQDETGHQIKMKQGEANFKQDFIFDRFSHKQDLMQDDEMHDQNMEQLKEQAKINRQVAIASARSTKAKNED